MMLSSPENHSKRDLTSGQKVTYKAGLAGYFKKARGSYTFFVAFSSIGRILRMNQALRQVVGARPELANGRFFPFHLVPREGRAALTAAIRHLKNHYDATLARVPIRGTNGDALQVEWRIRVVRGDDGRIRQFLAVGIEITERERQEKLQATRNHILESVSGQTMASLQEMLVDHILEIWPDHPVALLMLDASQGILHPLASRDLPDFFMAVLEGLVIGPGVGCSADAAFHGTRVVAEDIESHPNWHSYRDLAERARLRACWSEPIVTSDGQVLGTLSVYARRPERPTDGDLQILHEVATLASLLHERKQFEMQLALRNAAMEAAANAIAITDHRGVIEWVNGAFSALTGYSSEEVQGQPIAILKSPGQDQATHQSIWDTIQNGQAWKGELVNRRKDGSEYIEEQTITPVRGEDGSICHYITIKQDVSERKASEARLRKLSQAVEQAPSSVVITNASGEIEFVNPNFIKMTGYTAEEVLGKKPQFLQSDLTSPHLVNELWETILSGNIWRGELPCWKKDGQPYWEKLAISPVFDQHGAISHFAVNAEDVTTARQFEEARQRLLLALDQTTDATAILELDGSVNYANPAFHRALDLNDRSVIGESIITLLASLVAPVDLTGMISRVREGTTWKGRHCFQAADGENRTLDGTLSPVRGTDGAISGLVLVFRDVTREIEQGHQLLQAQMMDSLGALAGGVAHDFNNMLTVILTCTEMIELQLEPDSPIRSKLELIYQVIQQARGLNRQILSFSRRSEEKRIPFDLSEVAREVVRLLNSTVSKNIHLQVEIAPSIWLAGDPVKAHQVLLNLAINASQAIGDKPGQMTLSLRERVLEETDGMPLAPGRYAELHVQDSGSGMDPQTLERIFQPFFTTKKAGGGTGLGLAVVQGVVHASGGHIRVESTPGRGSSFWVYFPSGVEEVIKPSPSERPEVCGSEKILFVDDEDIITALAKQGLEGLGYQVVAKTSPVDALEVFRAQPGAFDLLVTDLELPTYSGAELTRRMRLIRPGMPAVLVTGTLKNRVTIPSLSVTFDEILEKPLMAKDLGAAIRRVLDTRRHESYPEPASLPNEDGQPWILLAEDSKVTRKLLKAWITMAGYQVMEAKDGQEAWERFVAAQGRTPFRMVLTDIVMPRMDGLELVERIRKVDPDIPVVITSSVGDAQVGNRAQYLHANELLVKPFTAEVLLATLARLFGSQISRTQQEQLKATAPAVGQVQKVMTAILEKDLPIFSICEPLTEAGGDVFRCLGHPGGEARLVLADVAGHSVLSSYAVASLLGMLATSAPECGGLRDLFRQANEHINTGPFPDIPIALLAADWDPRTGRLHVVNGDVPNGIWYRKGLGRTEPIALKGTPLGLFDKIRVQERVLVLEPGDRVLFGTDGFFDIRSAEGTFFRDQVPSQWQRATGVSMEQALEAMCGAARHHGDNRILDDLLVVGLEQPPWSPGPHGLVRVLPSQATSVDQAELAVDQLLAQHPRWRDLSRSRRFDLTLCLHEALNNALEHGNGGVPDKRIALLFHLTETAAGVRVVDEGPGFDLDAFMLPEAMDSERRRGVSILRQLTRGLRMCGGELGFYFDLEEADHGLDVCSV
jgi:PAS domain S-box-containing protein